MSKARFKYNPKTLSYERVDNTIKHKFSFLFSHLLSGFLVGLTFFVLFALFIPSPRVKKLESEKAELDAQFSLLSMELLDIQEVLADMEQRDDQLYRVVVQADPVANNIRKSARSQSKYNEILNKTNSEIAATTTAQLAEIRHRLYMQSLSFDELTNLVKILYMF